MTVREWILGRAPASPPVLAEHVMAALGADATADASETASACLRAATRSLRALLAGKQFGRDNAIDLLTIDALTTFAYEHASETLDVARLDAAAADGVRTLGQLAHEQ